MYQFIKIKFSKIYTRLMLLTCYTMSGIHLPLLFKFQIYPTNHKHHHCTYPRNPSTTGGQSCNYINNKPITSSLYLFKQLQVELLNQVHIKKLPAKSGGNLPFQSLHGLRNPRQQHHFLL